MLIRVAFHDFPCSTKCLQDSHCALMINGVGHTKSDAYCKFLNVSSQDHKKLSDPGPALSEG